MNKIEIKTNNLESSNKKIFFTKKKIILFSIGLIIFVIFIFLISKFFFNINFETIFNLLNKSYEYNNLFFLWLILLVFFPLYNCIFRILPYFYKLKQKRIYVEWYNLLIFGLVTFFIGAITPFAMGYEPYVIYWLKKNGLSLKESTALVASFTVLNPLIQVIITWPSFFILCTQYSFFTNKIEWIIAFWSVFIGLIIDLIGTCFWWLMSCSKNAHYFINIIINWFKKILRMKYKTKQEIKTEYKENATFKKIFFNELKDWKFILMIISGGLFWNILYYSSMIFAFNLMDPGYGFNAWELFNYTNVATTANNFIPIPGAEGTLQATLSIFIQSSNETKFTDPKTLSEICNNSVFIWRTFTFYLTAILGIFALIALIIKELYKFAIKKQKIKLKIKDINFGIILIINDFNQQLIDCLNLLSKIQYNHKLINIEIFTTKKLIKQQKQLIKEYLNDFNHNIHLLKTCNNLFNIINYLKTNKLLKYDYYNFIYSDDYLDIDIFENINNVLHHYDIYAAQYKQLNKQHHYKKISPFWFLYKKRFSNQKQMLSPYFNVGSFFVNKEILKKIKNNNNFKDYKNLYLFSLIIKYAKSLRYLRKMSGYFIKNNNEKQYTITFNKLIKLNNQELLLNNINKTKIKKFNLKREFEFCWLPKILQPIFNKKYNLIFKNNLNIKKMKNE